MSSLSKKMVSKLGLTTFKGFHYLWSGLYNKNEEAM